MIELFAFDSLDRIVHGMIELRGDRLADVLSQAPSHIAAESACTRGLRDGAIGLVPSKLVEVDLLSIVVATGPRGDQYRRVETISTPVSVHVGRYLVCGYIHAPAPQRPLLERDARPWFAITEAILEYTNRGRAVRERHDTVLVNRAHVSGIMPMDARSHEARWLASRPAEDWDGEHALLAASR
jgi:hypothetical protein